MRYGMELILDLKDCDSSVMNRKDLTRFFEELCELIKVERGDLEWWDFDGYPEEYAAAPDHLKGTSAVQFIMTSTIVVHTLDVLKKVFINVFSCDEFDAEKVRNYCERFFSGTHINKITVDRL